MTDTLPVYILARTPGAEGRTVEWTDICHNKEQLILIQHCEFLDEEWNTCHRCRPRSRQFVVRDITFDQISSHYTLEAAEKAAAKFAKQLAK